MYLPDHELERRLPELGITADHPGHPFDPAEQVQPCSIDLRLSDHFWKPSRRRNRWRRVFSQSEANVDLRRSHMEELDPRRDWRPVVLQEGQALTIKPGQVLMGRIYERFAIPKDCAGKVEGRSSYARLGLHVHCTADFINPGWRGYLPLQLHNAGPYPIKVTPFAPICQLMLVPLASTPRRSYGEADLQSKYVNDDGGPSFWWRDRQVKRLQERLAASSVPTGIEDEIVGKVRFQDPETLARFQRFPQSLASAAFRTRIRFFRASAARRADGSGSTAPPCPPCLSWGASPSVASLNNQSGTGITCVGR